LNIYNCENNFFLEIIFNMPKKNKKIEVSPTEHDSEEHRGLAKKRDIEHDELDDIEIDDELTIQKKDDDMYSETSEEKMDNESSLSISSGGGWDSFKKTVSEKLENLKKSVHKIPNPIP
jgi:hypothetical protein